MGSVSSLISGHGLHSKHCRATEHRLQKVQQARKNGRSLNSSGISGAPVAKNTESSKSEDFFFIKVSNRPRTGLRRSTMEDQWEGATKRDASNCSIPPKLVPMSGKLEKAVEKGLIRPTAFKPVIPRSNSCMESHGGLIQATTKRCGTSERENEPSEPRSSTNIGTLSDSGRNSMSSLPTHSTNYSNQADTGTSAGLPGCASLFNTTEHLSTSMSPGDITSVAPAFWESSSPEKCCHLLDNSGGCVRSPISMDESLIQQLEQRLLETETELQELQVSFEEKEGNTYKLFHEKQKNCAEELQGLKQQCSSQIQQASQKVLRAQQFLQRQITQLQQENMKLQDDLDQMCKGKDLMEVKLKSYEIKQSQLAPTLEETQWEVCQKTGEISLLKQQLKDSQADVNHKLNEIVTLKATLRESKAKMEVLEQQTKKQEEALLAKTVEVEVCENELQRKKNEADLLREKVGQLELDIRNLRQDLTLAKQQRQDSTDQVAGSEENADTETLRREVERLISELEEERKQKENMASDFRLERRTWDKEKDKVIRYQKQLQRNYLQMHHKNQELEKILRDLTAELANRTELDMDVQSGDIHFEDIIATEI